MINNEDKKYYGTDYSTQAILMEEEIFSYITSLNRIEISVMKEMRDVAEQLKKDRNNADLNRRLQQGQEDLSVIKENNEIIHKVLDMVQQLKNEQLPDKVPPKVLYDKIMDVPLMQNLVKGITFGEISANMFDIDVGPVAEAIKKYVGDNFVDSSEVEQELTDDYGIEFDNMYDYGYDFHEFVSDKLIENLNSDQKMTLIREMRDDRLISNRDYLRMYIANEAHKRQNLAIEMFRQQSVLEQTEENSFGGMRSSR